MKSESQGGEERRIWSLARKPLVLISVVAAAAVVAYAYLVPSRTQTEVKRLATDEIIVIRTPGGMLEVSTLIRNEQFGWSTKHDCLLIDCGQLLKATISEIRIPVHYTYRIPLAQNWTLKPKDAFYELSVPREQPKLPAAVDFTKMELKTNKGWFSPNVQENRETLLRRLGPELDRRATQAHYIDAQRIESQKTVVEFARKWMIEQGVDKSRMDRPIKVLFQDKAATDPQ